MLVMWWSLIGQGACTAEWHIMAAGVYGPSGQLIFDSLVVPPECISEVVTSQK